MIKIGSLSVKWTTMYICTNWYKAVLGPVLYTVSLFLRLVFFMFSWAKQIKNRLSVHCNEFKSEKNVNFGFMSTMATHF